MPLDPDTIGDAMIANGEKQISTGGKLKKAAGQLNGFAVALERGGTIDDSVVALRTDMTAIWQLLSPVVGALAFIRNAFNAFKVPTIDVSRTSIDFPVVGRIRFVTGIDIGSTAPFAGVAARVEAIRINVSDVRASVRTMGISLRDLRNQMPGIQAELMRSSVEIDGAGTDMVAGGNEMIDAGEEIKAP